MHKEVRARLAVVRKHGVRSIIPTDSRQQATRSRCQLVAPLHSHGVNDSLPSNGTSEGRPEGVPTLGPLPSAAPLVATTTRRSSEDAPCRWPSLQPPFSYYATAEDAQSNAAPSGLTPIWKVLLLSDGSVTRHLQLLSGSPVTVECMSMRNVGWSLEGLPPGTELIPGPRVQRQVLLRCEGAGLAFNDQLGSGSPPYRRAPRGDTATTTTTTTSMANSTASTGSPGLSAPGTGSLPDSGSDPPGSGSPPSSRRRPGQPLVYASSWWNADTVDEYLRDKSKPIWISLSQGHVELYREVHALFRGGSSELESLLGCPGPFWGRQYVFWSGGRPLTLIYEVFSPRLRQYLGPERL